MILKNFACILLFSLTVYFSACSNLRSTPMTEVKFEDENTSGDVVITDEDLQSKQVPTSKGMRTEPNQILADKSEVVTMFDGYGNKTETRYFKSHPRLDIIIVRTAVDNTRQVFVYGFGGKTVSMPEEFAVTALNASADEIAEAAGLKQTRPFKSSFPLSTPTPAPRVSKIPTQVRPVVVQPQIQTEDSPNTENPSQETEQPSNQTQNPQFNEQNKQ